MKKKIIKHKVVKKHESKQLEKKIESKIEPKVEVTTQSSTEYVPQNDVAKDSYAPSIVKAIAVFEYVAAGLGIIFGIILLFARDFILTLIPLEEMPQVPATALNAAMGIMAVFMIVLGIVAIFIAKNLWNYKNWARIVLLIFSSIGVLFALLSIPQGILGLLIHGAIVYFLGFDKKVVALFK